MSTDLDRLVGGTRLPSDAANAGVSIHTTLSPLATALVTAADGANKPQRPDTLISGVESDGSPDLVLPSAARVNPGLNYTRDFLETGPSEPISAKTPTIRTFDHPHLDSGEEITAHKHLRQQDNVVRSQPLGSNAEKRLEVMNSKAQVAYGSLFQDDLPIEEPVSPEGEHLRSKFSDIILNHGRLAEILKAASAHPALDSELIYLEFELLLSHYCRDIRWSSTTPFQDQVAFLLGESTGTIKYWGSSLLGLNHAQSSLKGIEKHDTMRAAQRTVNELASIRHSDDPVRTDQGPMSDSKQDSEDGGDVEDAILAEAGTVVRFLIDGMPMKTFRTHLLKCVLQEAKDQDVGQDIVPLPRSLPNLVEETWHWISFMLPESRVPPGKRRIRWTCVGHTSSRVQLNQIC